MTMGSPIVPAWFGLPMGAAVLVVLAGHLIWVGRSGMEGRRRRLRIATSGCMMLATALLVYASSMVTPREPRSFVLAWVLTAGVVAMVLVLALVDVAHTLALHRAEVRSLREEFARSRGGPGLESGLDSGREPGGGRGPAA